MRDSRKTDDALSTASVNLLRKVVRAIQLYSEAVEKELDLTGPQLWALWELNRHGPQTLKMLAGRLFVTPPTLVGVIDRLEAKKLVARSPDPADRRKIGISITAAGKRMVVRAPVPAQAQLARALRRVPADRLRAFHKTLGELAATMEAEKLKVSFFFSER